MASFEVVESIEIAAPPQPVWAYRLDYTTLPDYNPQVTGLERIDGATEPGVGARYRFLVDMGAGQIESVLTVVEAVPYSRIVNDVVGETGTAREVVTVEPVGTGCRLEIAISAQLPDGVDAETRGAAISGSRALARLELENIKKAIEART
jgi:uncharacterized protein YndB with AHSA1/START domain